MNQNNPEMIDNPTPHPESICQEAHRIQGGDRQQDYGHPRDNFENIAKFWNSYLNAAHGDHPPIEAVDVANMMILLKMARNIHKPKRDSWVDMAAYSQCGAKIQEL